jgi:hypothetical protein
MVHVDELGEIIFGSDARAHGLLDSAIDINTDTFCLRDEIFLHFSMGLPGIDVALWRSTRSAGLSVCAGLFLGQPRAPAAHQGVLCG